MTEIVELLRMIVWIQLRNEELFIDEFDNLSYRKSIDDWICVDIKIPAGQKDVVISWLLHSMLVCR
jgi:hypothetical protein